MKNLLIINADDFGFSHGQNYGIIESFKQGCVRSTTAMVNMPACEHAAELSKQNPDLGVGLHFVLTLGKPLTNVPSLVNQDGDLDKGLWQKVEQGSINPAEVRQELEAQFQLFCQLFDQEPTHIDSHHHVHFLNPIYPIVSQFALEKNLPIRISKTEIKSELLAGEQPHSTCDFDSTFYGDQLTVDSLLTTLQQAKQNQVSSLEVMCHPAFLDPSIQASGYNLPRVTEYKILTDPKLQTEIAKIGFELGNFRGL